MVKYQPVPNVCTGSNPTRDAGKVVYIHVSCCCNISEFKFSMGCVRIINIAKLPNLPYHHQKHPIADTPYVGPRARMSTCTYAKLLSDIH